MEDTEGEGGEKTLAQSEEYDEYLKMVSKRKEAENKVHVPKTVIEKIDKIILFGHIYHGATEEENELYQFVHQRMDGVITEGYIPVGFLSSIFVHNVTLYFATRKGKCGPEFQLSMRTPGEVIVDWDLSPDAMWSSVLNYFDKKALFPEAVLDYLDADPFVLFGIDDPITQRAIRRLEKQPVLLSRGEKPDIIEWSDYLGGRISGIKRNKEFAKNTKTRWVIQALAETELPTPWTSYKGIGNIVCFMNHETGVCSWKHPFYEYFSQLWNYCMEADDLDVKRIRVNRLIWNYEASQNVGVIQQPLVSPEYIEQLADIMGFDVSEEPFIVRTLKAALKTFSQMYRLTEDVDKDKISELTERIKCDREANRVMLQTWRAVLSPDVTFELDDLANGKVVCVECQNKALSFCLECKDYFCIACFVKLHSKGNRKLHVPFRLIPCSMCSLLPAKVHCTFTDKSFCHECYAMKHVIQLPGDAREIAPKKINYAKQQTNVIKTYHAQEMSKSMPIQEDDIGEDHGSCASVLTVDWHQFFDGKGIKYYYNFRTGERIRRSPSGTPLQSADPSEAGDVHHINEENKEDKTHMCLEPRSIRAPYRSHPDACSTLDINVKECTEELRSGEQHQQICP